MSGYAQIAIDGPAGSGKTTVARALAKRLGFLYLDTGAMYRAVALLALQSASDEHDEERMLELARARPIRVLVDDESEDGFRVFAGGVPIGNELYGNDVSQIVSAVAAHPSIRSMLVERQRDIAATGPVVMAGRDIGTVVLPDAPVKIFLTASLDERVERRLAELAAHGTEVDRATLRREMLERDRLDTTREVAPLRPATGAHEIDSSGMSIDEVVDRIAAIAAHAPSEAPSLASAAPAADHGPASAGPGGIGGPSRPDFKSGPSPGRNQSLFYRFARVVLWFGLRAWNDLTVIGKENVPAEGPVIIACNHVSYVDPPALGCGLPRQVWYMAKTELFKIPILAPIIRGLGAFPVDRSRGDIAAIKAASQVLKGGRVLGIFPEGTRNLDGTGKPQMGVALLASLTGATVVPAYVGGTRDAVRRSKITVIYGTPIRFTLGRKARRDDLAKWTEDLMLKIYALRENIVGN
jgi:cytidylate kinase